MLDLPATRSVRRFVETRDWGGILATLKASGLRGMGGAGFPTGMKWEMVRNAAGTRQVHRLQRGRERAGHDQGPLHHGATAPHLVIEGMILGRPGHRRAPRHPLHPPRVRRARSSILQHEIDRCYRDGIARRATLWAASSTFDLEIFVSPGGYICGEESALLEAIEGKRAEPRNKPPFPGTARPVAEADRHQQRRDVRSYVPAILARGVGLVQGAGPERLAGREVCRRQRRRQ